MSAARTPSKEHDERKNDILDAAQELFTQSGYDATPVSAIIDKLGISKGTFYHYFDSKDELLDCLALRITNRILDRARESTKDEMDAVTKLNTFFSVAGRWKAANLGVILMLARAMYRDENIPLRCKITQRMVDTCAPFVADIVAEGVGEGVFDATCPEDVAELIFQIMVAMRESTAGLFLELDHRPELWPVIERKIAGFEVGFEVAVEEGVRLACRDPHRNRYRSQSDYQSQSLSSARGAAQCRAFKTRPPIANSTSIATPMPMPIPLP